MTPKNNINNNNNNNTSKTKMTNVILRKEETTEKVNRPDYLEELRQQRLEQEKKQGGKP